MPEGEGELGERHWVQTGPTERLLGIGELFQVHLCEPPTAAWPSQVQAQVSARPGQARLQDRSI